MGALWQGCAWRGNSQLLSRDDEQRHGADRLPCHCQRGCGLPGYPSLRPKRLPSSDLILVRDVASKLLETLQRHKRSQPPAPLYSAHGPQHRTRRNRLGCLSRLSTRQLHAAPPSHACKAYDPVPSRLSRGQSTGVMPFSRWPSSHAREATLFDRPRSNRLPRLRRQAISVGVPLT
jgi:hypothetical protein